MICYVVPLTNNDTRDARNRNEVIVCVRSRWTEIFIVVCDIAISSVIGRF